MTHDKAYSLLELIATNLTGELMSEQDKKRADYLDSLIGALDVALGVIKRVNTVEIPKDIDLSYYDLDEKVAYECGYEDAIEYMRGGSDEQD